MKKIIILFAMLASLSFAVFAADDSGSKNNDGKSSLTYVNFPVLKVFEGKDGYRVIYQKNHIGVGSTVIPKAWAKGNPENPRKLKVRNLEKGILDPFMTVVKKDGEFHRVILTLPLSKQHSVWGLADYTRPMEGVDKETLEELPL